MFKKKRSTCVHHQHPTSSTCFSSRLVQSFFSSGMQYNKIRAVMLRGEQRRPRCSSIQLGWMRCICERSTPVRTLRAGPPAAAAAAGIWRVLPAEVWSSAPCLRPARQPPSSHLPPLPLCLSSPRAGGGARLRAQPCRARCCAAADARRPPPKHIIFHGFQADGEQLDDFYL